MNAELRPSVDGTFRAESLTFERSALSADAVASALKEYGAALVRGVVPGHLIPAMVLDIDGYLRWLENGRRMWEASQYARYGNVNFSSVAEFGTHSVLEALYHLVAPPFADVLYAYFQVERVSALLWYTHVRVHRPSDTASISPWHQDATAVPVPAPLLTCWIPLNRCGVTSPGLEVIARHREAPLPVSQNPRTNHARTEIDDLLVNDRDFRWRPEFAAGDVMIFEGMTVHRTYITEAMSEARHSIELRFFATERAPLEWRAENAIMMADIPRRTKTSEPTSRSGEVAGIIGSR